MSLIGRAIAPIQIPKQIPVKSLSITAEIIEFGHGIANPGVTEFGQGLENPGNFEFGYRLEHSPILLRPARIKPTSFIGNTLASFGSESITEQSSLDKWLCFRTLPTSEFYFRVIHTPRILNPNEYPRLYGPLVHVNAWLPTKISENLFQKVFPGNVRGRQYVRDKEPLQQSFSVISSTKRGGKKREQNSSPEQASMLTTDVHAPSPKPFDEFDLLYPLLLPPLKFGTLENKALPFPLRDYQWKGVSSLIQNPAFLLADEMGTGKTVMTCVALKAMFQRGEIHSVLILCPKSVIRVWTDHLRDWTPELRVNVVRATDQRSLLWNQPAHVWVASYDTFRSDVEHKVLNNGHPDFDVVVVDEAQAIKNYDSKRSQVIRKTTSRYRWAVTGTPLENRVEDAISILAFLYPARIKHDQIKTMGEQAVREELKHCMLRRLKKDVLKDLPPIVRQEMWLEMDDAQLKAYAAEYNIEVERLRQLQAGSGEFKIRSAAIQAIQKLKQICNFAPNSIKSPKLEALLDVLEELEGTDQKMVVFSQYIKEGLHKMEQALQPRSGIGTFDGSMSDESRVKVVNSFRKDPKQKALLISLRAGGTGLSLTEASYVVMFDPWWNPAVMRQAEDRVHRFGQKAERVTVYQLAMAGTIEERIYQLLEQKRQLAARVVDSLADGTAEVEQTLTTGELLGLFNLRVDEHGKVVDSVNVPKITAPLQPSPGTPEKSLDEIYRGFLQISPEGFEKLVESVIKKMGYPQTQHTGKTADGGVDVLAWRNATEGPQVAIVQCKRFTHNVSVQVVRDLYGVINAYDKPAQGFIFASSNFTPQARSFVAQTGGRIRLINGFELARLIQQFGIKT